MNHDFKHSIIGYSKEKVLMYLEGLNKEHQEMCHSLEQQINKLNEDVTLIEKDIEALITERDQKKKLFDDVISALISTFQDNNFFVLSAKKDFDEVEKNKIESISYYEKEIVKYRKKANELINQLKGPVKNYETVLEAFEYVERNIV